MGLTVKKIIGCARCGLDHLGVVFERLDRPFAPSEARGMQWTHWAPCPTNGHPIMLTGVAHDEGDDEEIMEAVRRVPDEN